MNSSSHLRVTALPSELLLAVCVSTPLTDNSKMDQPQKPQSVLEAIRSRNKPSANPGNRRLFPSKFERKASSEMCQKLELLYGKLKEFCPVQAVSVKSNANPKENQHTTQLRKVMHRPTQSQVPQDMSLLDYSSIQAETTASAELYRNLSFYAKLNKYYQSKNTKTPLDPCTLPQQLPSQIPLNELLKNL